jgi:hypothetical protein
VRVPGLVESDGAPLVNRHSGRELRSRIHLPNGFEYTFVEIGRGTSRARAALEITLDGTHGQFHVLHMNQDGVIR